MHHRERGLAVFVAVAALVAAVGCRDDGGAPRGESLSSVAAPGAAQESALDGLTAELAAIRKTLRGGGATDLGCEATALLAADLRERPSGPRVLAALAERDRLCEREVPLTALTAALARLDERRAAGVPGARADAADCAAAGRAAKPLRDRHADEPAVVALLERLSATCGESPQP